MGLFSFLGFDGNAIRERLRQGAVIIDVRPPYQYDQGKVYGSLNIPVEQIAKNAAYIKKMGKPVVLCGSGADSNTARRILQRQGISQVYNGGSWEQVLRLLNSL